MNTMLSVQQASCNTEPAPLVKWVFDLTNPVHVNMRRLMADVYQLHCAALKSSYEKKPHYYLGLAYGLFRVSRLVLKDTALTVLCFDLIEALRLQAKLHSELRG